MSKNEFNNEQCCPFCRTKVHPVATVCTGCGASYEKESRGCTEILILLISIFFFTLIVFNFDKQNTVGIFIAFIILFCVSIGAIRFINHRRKYIWVRKKY